MQALDRTLRSVLQPLLILLSVCVSAASLPVQNPTGQQGRKPAKTDSTIRVRVGLVQTDVTVFDKQGRFVEGLNQDQFQLLVDGKPEPISFLELVSSASPKPEAAPVRTSAPKGTAPGGTRASPPDSGRTLLFFLDDWHMSADSTMRSREALSRLIDSTMGPNDRAALFTASNQLGFLQQLSDNKSVLRRALARLHFTTETVRDQSRPAMSEAQANAIEMNDPNMLGYFIDQTVAAEGLNAADRAMAEQIVRHRATALAQISAEFTARTLTTLRRLVSSCGALPGRKLIFFLSDGFVLQPQRDDVVYRLRQVTDAAASAGIVIYSLDTRGLVVGLPDATTQPAFAIAGEPAGRLESASSEILAAQDGLNALASDTGGRFIKNTNALDTAIVESLEESSRYYLLGWHVDPDKLKLGHNSSIRVAIKDRPELKVRVRHGSMDLSRLIAEEKSRADSARITSNAGKELSKALDYPWPIHDLPVFLYAGYVYLPDLKELVLDIAMQVDIESADSGEKKANDLVRIDVLGAVANREGKIVASFEISPQKPASPSNMPRLENNRFFYSRYISMEPGIYQVRVAAWDPENGRVGSAHQWVELSASVVGKILIGSIFLTGQHFPDPPQVNLKISDFDVKQIKSKCLFASGDNASFIVQIFNPADFPLLFQTRIYRGNQVVRQSDPREVPAQDPAYTGPAFLGGELKIEGLAAGSYVLEVVTTDPSGQVTASQRVPFWIL